MIAAELIGLHIVLVLTGAAIGLPIGFMLGRWDKHLAEASGRATLRVVGLVLVAGLAVFDQATPETQTPTLIYGLIVGLAVGIGPDDLVGFFGGRSKNDD